MKLLKSSLLIGFCALFLFMSGRTTQALQESVSQKGAGESRAVESMGASNAQVAAAANAQYVVIAWNDLGMHCISPRFDQMAILPPFNNLIAQVIKKGNPPQIVTSGVSVEYSVPNNTTVAGKTNFWQYARPLFGVDLPQGIGLTGNGLSGRMAAVGTRFEATGIPVLPYDDQLRWNPYQLATVNLKNGSGSIIATASAVLPVSDEMHCDRCHADGGAGAAGTATGSVEGNILTLHDRREGTSLMASRPVLCASCHSDNALGTPGQAGVESMSLAMHGKHSTVARQPSCYDCHPGDATRCNRSALEGMGPRGTDPRCSRCHGGLSEVAQSIRNGRQPWLEEPTCAQCHGSEGATPQPLYRNSTGHGGVYCSACHNSPHAWYPSKQAVDNKQPVALQGSSGAIGRCSVCHTNRLSGENPHEGSND